MTYKLYIKTHSQTGLKYLGKTETDNPYYRGSGLYWVRHLKKYGGDITSKIVFETDDYEIFKDRCIYYSKLWNVVESDEWANLVEETGENKGREKGYKHHEESKKKISIKNKGKIGPTSGPDTEEWKKKISISLTGKKLSEEHKNSIRQSKLGQKASEETKQKLKDIWARRKSAQKI